ncbi:hypothetical protein [Thalassomonas sp. M1454]|uniref:hypothetical protein n=1 Tax=Thalassomonas sp. M1454 TaxID=2594477 RepID=UPI001180A342|nr:hypothetical protein [Thalassomonas sp. M1454]TRX56421.1 hypothetical protein FNN08_02505 [Thalassomonas sp. M1454]
MKDSIKINICLNGHEQQCHNALSKVISEKLLLKKIEFYERMARVSQQYDERAGVDLNSLTINKLSLNENSGKVDVTYLWDAYHDFEDISASAQVQDIWRFRVENNQAVFKLDLPEQHLSHEI